MMTPLPILSASSLPRVSACPASHVLPQTKLATSEAAARGINIHAFLETAFTQGREAALEQFAADLPGIGVARAIDLQMLWSDVEEGSAEAPFAFDANNKSARILGTGLKRQYENTGEIVGTADFVGRHKDTKQILVADYKTGIVPIDAATNQQLAFLALCAALVYDADEVIARIVTIREDATFHFNERIYAREHLLEFGDNLAALQTVLNIFAAWYEAGKILPVNVGDHCKYCPTISACPAAAAVLTRYDWAAKKEDLQTWDLANLEAKDAGALWERLLVIEKAVELQKNALKDFARTQPIETNEGKQLMLGSQIVTQIVLGRALEIIAEIYGQDLADHLLGATNAKLPKTELEAALKSAGLQGGELRKVMAKLNQEFEQKGALVFGTREVMQAAEKAYQRD